MLAELIDVVEEVAGGLVNESAVLEMTTELHKAGKWQSKPSFVRRTGSSFSNIAWWT